MLGRPPTRDRSGHRLAASASDEGIESLADLPAERLRQSASTRSWSGGSPAKSGSRRSASRSRVAPLMKIVSRGDTTVVDAYLNPVLRAYVGRLARRSIGRTADLQILTSAGGLVDADRFVGKDSILSGPAGGVVGFSQWPGPPGSSGPSASTWAAPAPTSRGSTAATSWSTRPRRPACASSRR